jgi:hypothetical protein
MKPKSKPPVTKRLKLKRDILLSNFAFKFSLRRYIKTARTKKKRALTSDEQIGAIERACGRGLHSFTSQLSLSRV